jgi:hypothetical protein
LTGRYAWPPRKEDLERLYLVEKLSAAKIADAYGLTLKYKTPKVAESTVLYHLKKNGIQRRDSAEHVRKVTEKMADDWAAKYQAGLSLKQIAGDAVDPVTVWNHLKARGLKLRDKVEAQIQAVTKHERRPFGGDQIEKAYLIGLRCGDLHVVRHGRAVRVRLSTTHPAMIELFRGLFSRHGPIYQYPKKSDLTGYEWCLDCDLDESFEFLLDPQEELDHVLSSEELFVAFLAGFFDAEGSVYFHKKRNGGGFEFSLTNLNEVLLHRIEERLVKDGYSPKLRRFSQIPSRGVVNGGEYIFRLSLWRYQEVRQILTGLPLRHGEKLAKRELALSLAYRARKSERQALIEQWKELREGIRRERDSCVKQAEMAFHANEGEGRKSSEQAYFTKRSRKRA